MKYLIGLCVIFLISCNHNYNAKSAKTRAAIESIHYDQLCDISKGFYAGHKIRMKARISYYVFAGWLDDGATHVEVNISDIFGIEEL